MFAVSVVTVLISEREVNCHYQQTVEKIIQTKKKER